MLNGFSNNLFYYKNKSVNNSVAVLAKGVQAAALVLVQTHWLAHLGMT